MASDIRAVGLALAAMEREARSESTTAPGNGQLDGVEVDGSQAPDGGRRAMAEEGGWPQAEERREKVGAVRDPAVTDGVDVMEEPL
jgi:hypothetical protein